LSALEAADGRRKRRKRDQTPDTIGLNVKRQLLEDIVKEDPAPEAFEEWLLRYTLINDATGAVGAMARAVLEEWRLAHSLNEFKSWLERGAPSEDAVPTGESPFPTRLRNA
jgi:hypothetical protein